ncbi:MAG: ATP-binding protein [Candidatus Ozemobacteraceae bacterium]
MIKRKQLHQQIADGLRRSRVVALLGPRQCGKTTIAREFVRPDSVNYFDLEDPFSQGRLATPMETLQSLRGLVVIDEIQRAPELFPILRVLADRKPIPARFLILGSASSALVKGSSESLAGRLTTIGIQGFNLSEVGEKNLKIHWTRGGFPLSFLGKNVQDSYLWRRDLIQTFLERDLPQLGFSLPARTLLKFWTMVAHYHGQIWNNAEPARSLGVSEPTIRRYLDILEGLFLIRQLQPWHQNLNKRQVKSPKVFIRDTGILHALMGIKTERDLTSHPKCGASWEGYVIEEISRTLQPDEIYFWATHNGAELDLLVLKDGKKYGFECKRSDKPSITPSIRIALEDLALEHVFIVYPGKKSAPLSEMVSIIPLPMIADIRLK